MNAKILQKCNVLKWKAFIKEVVRSVCDLWTKMSLLPVWKWWIMNHLPLSDVFSGYNKLVSSSLFFHKAFPSLPLFLSDLFPPRWVENHSDVPRRTFHHLLCFGSPPASHLPACVNKSTPCFRVVCAVIGEAATVINPKRQHAVCGHILNISASSCNHEMKPDSVFFFKKRRTDQIYLNIVTRAKPEMQLWRTLCITFPFQPHGAEIFLIPPGFKSLKSYSSYLYSIDSTHSHGEEWGASGALGESETFKGVKRRIYRLFCVIFIKNHPLNHPLF